MGVSDYWRAPTNSDRANVIFRRAPGALEGCNAWMGSLLPSVGRRTLWRGAIDLGWSDWDFQRSISGFTGAPLIKDGPTEAPVQVGASGS